MHRRAATPAWIPLAVVFALATWPCAASAAAPPNVVLVVVDTMRADHLGSYGYGRPTSPRLDALASAGVRFARAYATSSWTAPSVATILTGLYPVKHGVQVPTSRLRPTTAVMAQTFKSAGYNTVAYSANPAFVSSRQGFDRGFAEFNLVHGGPSTDPDDADVMPAGPGGGGDQLKVANAKTVTNAALAWFERTPQDKPFFLYVHYFDPHGGYFPPVDYAERFGVPADSPMRTAAQKRFWTEKPGKDDLRLMESLYDGEIAFTDAEIGRLLDGLPNDRPALIALTADHGEEFMEHGGVSHARTLFEEQVHVPLVFFGAGVSPGKTIERAVTIADVWPTLAEMAGLAVPRDLDGTSLAPSLRDGAEPAARPLFADMVKVRPKQDMIHRHAVVDGSWKLIEGVDASLGLYDLATDPGEQHDRFGVDATSAAPLQRSLAAHDPLPSRRAAAAAPTVALSEHDKERMRALGYATD